jgi:hypothetical protein
MLGVKSWIEVSADEVAYPKLSTLLGIHKRKLSRQELMAYHGKGKRLILVLADV